MAYDRIIPLDLGGALDTFQGLACETISGGDLVACSGGTTTKVGSFYDTFVTADVQLVLASTLAAAKDAASGSKGVVGIALTTATSGNAVAFLRKGTVILPAGSDDVAC